jgi:hypothetical protein
MGPIHAIQPEIQRLDAVRLIGPHAVAQDACYGTSASAADIACGHGCMPSKAEPIGERRRGERVNIPGGHCNTKKPEMPRA